MSFVAPSHFFTQRISIDVIGAGGTGSYLLSYLAQIHYLLRMVGGNDNPFDVTVWDRDTVSETNVGRQNFWPIDIGLPKAEVLVERINNGFGTGWTAKCTNFSPSSYLKGDIVMTCVDSASFRYELGKNAAEESHYRDKLWIDGGNGQHTGQIIMGHLGNTNKSDYLPNLYDLYGETLLESTEHAMPSCSHAESIRRQDFGVNHTTAFQMANLVWQMLRHGSVEYQGGFFNLKTGELNPIEPLENVWAAFGYEKDKNKEK